MQALFDSDTSFRTHAARLKDLSNPMISPGHFAPLLSPSSRIQPPSTPLAFSKREPLPSVRSSDHFLPVKSGISSSFKTLSEGDNAFSSSNGMRLKVRTMGGKTIVLEGVREEDSIMQLKQKVEEKEGMPVDQQRLIAGGKQLEDHLTIRDYDLKEDSVLHLVLRLRGGTRFWKLTV
ncbi:ribosomal-ubiquitin protein RPL40 [Cardiosporidium cionae]|uniref:Ribosomal-ubiquitin protein RPL40 n=1 Tax=Cardiosporidium cionae TaxID=476202 RepID=A0ABQ7JAW9_9APIC|nr:ribosomal-ubiquitin protein RPL40 [Cardiosporidium cionae]|eukprot:KAF8821137.1 ribosomal-ubiquitin protein RPL40 [Cardiosporidium cionae]